MKDHRYYVYILTNQRHTVYYTGVTNDLRRRMEEHRQKVVEGFTKRYNITKLLYYEETADVRSAIEREKQVKDYRREKKLTLIALMNPAFKDLYDDTR